jgi:hypothetical protein
MIAGTWRRADESVTLYLNIPKMHFTIFSALLRLLAHNLVFPVLAWHGIDRGAVITE